MYYMTDIRNLTDPNRVYVLNGRFVRVYPKTVAEALSEQEAQVFIELTPSNTEKARTVVLSFFLTDESEIHEVYRNQEKGIPYEVSFICENVNEKWIGSPGQKDSVKRYIKRFYMVAVDDIHFNANIIDLSAY